MISIGTGALRVTERPATAPVIVDAAGDTLFEVSNPFEAIGSVTFNGNAGDSGAGWSVGFVQAQWIETNWGDYRGLTQADGSSFLQRARPPSRPRQACIDNSNPGDRFYALPSEGPDPPTDGGAALPFSVDLPARPSFPLTVQVLHRDLPSDSYACIRTNGVTGQPNFLREAQVELSFCAALVVRGPGGLLRFVKGIYWNVNWQAAFRYQEASATMFVTPKPAGMRGNVGKIFDGRPQDVRFLTVLTTRQATNCTRLANNAANFPIVRERRGWATFDVTV